jgi:hypothetical protein
MRKSWKTPTGVRLHRIEQWAEARFERAVERGDTAITKRAADFYTRVAARANSVALGSVSACRD